MLRAVSEVTSLVLPERDANPFYHWDGVAKIESPKKLAEKVERVSPKKRRLGEIESSERSQALLASVVEIASNVFEEVPLGPPPPRVTSKSLTVLSWDSEEEDLPSPSVENKLPHKLHYVEGDDFHVLLLGNKPPYLS